jgi:hypothetical protein
MECRNHAGTAASASCDACAEPFCAACLVNVRGAPHCSQCKLSAVGPGPEVGEPSPAATSALRWSIGAFFCFGFVLGPIAISKALKAKKELDSSHSQRGRGRADAAIFLGSAALLLWVVNAVTRFKR